MKDYLQDVVHFKLQLYVLCIVNPQVFQLYNIYAICSLTFAAEKISSAFILHEFQVYHAFKHLHLRVYPVSISSTYLHR